jgi:hypothetical protein
MPAHRRVFDSFQSLVFAFIGIRPVLIFFLNFALFFYSAPGYPAATLIRSESFSRFWNLSYPISNDRGAATLVMAGELAS